MVNCRRVLPRNGFEESRIGGNLLDPRRLVAGPEYV
jgi:hypothetical protein